MNKHPNNTNPVDFKKARLVSQFDSLMRSWSEDTAVSRLSRRLQTTLEIAELLTIFMEELDAIVSLDHYRYVGTDDNHVIETGKRGRHHCDYRLTLHEQALGTLIISRSKRFAEEELQVIETFLTTLVFPLRNAITYFQMARAAMTDALTGLGNKRALDNQMHREIDMAARRNESLSVIVADIDQFKRINDGHGHAFGDEVIRKIADVMRNVMRRSDLCFRYGGEEFVMLLANADGQEAHRVAERLRQAIAIAQVMHGTTRVPVTLSCGVATLQSGERLEHFFERADQALYTAKRGGRNCVVTASASLADEPARETKDRQAS